MDSGGGARRVDRCHRFCPPAPGLTAPLGGDGGASRATEEFSFDLVEGELIVRDREPYALTNPTTIEGTNTDGVLSGGSFETPTVTFEQDITDPVAAHVVIDAEFSQVAPATGTINSDGDMVVLASLAVDLHVDVQPPGGGAAFLVADCTSSPVLLTLESTSPYVDPDGAGGAPGRVTLADEDFSVPPTVVEEPCNDLVQASIDDQLAGPGHALSLTMEGEITPPLPPGCSTTGALTVDPPGGSDLGDPVTLSAVFTPDVADPECIAAATASEIPTGFVDFLDDGRVIDTVPIDADFTAETTTSTIPAGPRTLNVRYRGGGSYNPSDPAPDVAYQVSAPPGITSTLPEYFQIGGDAAEFDVTATNTGFGNTLTNARIDITMNRRNDFLGGLPLQSVVLEYQDAGGAWVPVTLTAFPVGGLFGEAGSRTNPLLGSVGVPEGFPFPLGAEKAVPLRVQVTDVGDPGDPGSSCPPEFRACPGLVEVSFDVISVDPVTGAPPPAAAPAPGALATVTGTTTLVEESRRPSTVLFASSFSGGPISPHTVRQGSTIVIPGLTAGPQIAGIKPQGFFEFFIDGQQVGARDAQIREGVPDVSFLRLPIPRNGLIGVVEIDLPLSVNEGVHQVQVRYSGSDIFLPSQASRPITVVEAVGTAYDCQTLTPTQRFHYRALVEAQANVPSVRPAGSEAGLGNIAVRMMFSRAQGLVNTARALNLLPNDETTVVGEGADDGDYLTGIALGFGPGGEGSATEVHRTGGTRLPSSPNPAPLSDVDDTFVLGGTSGSVDLEGAPGDVVPVTLGPITLNALVTGFPNDVHCVPVADPVPLGSVTLSGATLSVTPGGPVREGDEVTLSSTVAPVTAGFVEFRDGDQTIGVVPVDETGAASMVTGDLPDGTRSLTARFFGGVLAPAMVSPSVELVVVATECEAFAVEGHGATVRLVYLELLGRCPDQAGFDYWVDRLEDGLSPEVFARIIAATPEAVGRVVDDAYRTMLDRVADPSGRAFWTGQLQAHGRYDRLLADLGASDEFWTLAGATNEGFVTRVYERLLNRAPEQSGLDYWVGRLEDGASRRALILSLANLDEPLGVLVRDSYDEILDRAPSTGERADGIDHLRATGDRSGLYAELIGRSEFEDRAQDFPNTEG